jgi:hypothetical protein
MFEDVVKRVETGVIAPIADDDQDLSVARAELKVLDGAIDRIIWSRHSSSRRVSQRRAELCDVAREHGGRWKAWPDSLVEVHSEELVEGMTDGGKRRRRRSDVLATAAHAAAAVNHQSNGCRPVVVREELNLLRLAVVVDLEMLRGRRVRVLALPWVLALQKDRRRPSCKNKTIAQRPSRTNRGTELQADAEQEPEVQNGYSWVGVRFDKCRGLR